MLACGHRASPLAHVLAVVADQNGAFNAGDLGQGIDKAGVFILQANFGVELHGIGPDGFALDDALFHLGLKEIHGVLLGILIGAVENHHIGGYMALFFGEHQQHQADEHAAQHRQGDHAGGQNDARGDGPEEEGNVQGFLDGCSETDDGQSAYHAQGKHHIGGDGQNDKGGDHGQAHQCHAKAGGIHDPGIGLAVDEKDEKAYGKGQTQGQHHVQDRNAGHIFQKAGFENI